MESAVDYIICVSGTPHNGRLFVPELALSLTGSPTLNLWVLYNQQGDVYQSELYFINRLAVSGADRDAGPLGMLNTRHQERWRSGGTVNIFNCK